jgi:hypothetical protein
VLYWEVGSGYGFPIPYIGLEPYHLESPSYGNTDVPGYEFTFDYGPLFSKTLYFTNPDGSFTYVPFEEGVLGTTVTLSVTDADGLFDSVTHTLPFRDAIINLSRLSGAPPCHVQLDVTAPPVFPSSSPLLLQTSTVSVPFDCKVALCGGMVLIRVPIPLPRPATDIATAAGARGGSDVVGETRFTLAMGGHIVVKVKLNKRGRSLARHGRLHRLDVSVTTLVLGHGKPKTVSHVFAVHRARR